MFTLEILFYQLKMIKNTYFQSSNQCEIMLNNYFFDDFLSIWLLNVSLAQSFCNNTLIILKSLWYLLQIIFKMHTLYFIFYPLPRKCFFLIKICFVFYREIHSLMYFPNILINKPLSKNLCSCACGT